MIKKLAKYGNSLALLIDKPILELLEVNEQTQLRITTDGSRIIIEPIRSEALSHVSEHENVQKSYERIVEKYHDAFKKLAKN